MHVKIFDYAYEYKDWMEDQDYKIEVVSLIVFNENLILTYNEGELIC